ncbi:MAG: hypothetical protein IJS88_00015 [Alphaproteobacteria bacterium]|nr:hypothetical protein [Alphaproteobacteria bacterium]
MKSAIFSLLALILIFTLLKFGALSVIGSKFFHYTAYIILVIVITGAVFIVGIRNKDEQSQQDIVLPQEEQSDEK